MSKDTKKEKSEKNTKKEQKNNFMKELNVELKKVTWPTRKELISSTSTVLFITLLIAVIVFCLDFTFEKINTNGVEKLKSVVSASESSEDDSEVVEDTTDEESDSTDSTDETTESTEESTDSDETVTEVTEETEENTAQ